MYAKVFMGQYPANFQDQLVILEMTNSQDTMSIAIGDVLDSLPDGGETYDVFGSPLMAAFPRDSESGKRSLRLFAADREGGQNSSFPVACGYCPVKFPTRVP